MTREESRRTARGEGRRSRPIADNRKAFHDYHILETFEAGIALLGTEVKGIREGQANLRDSYARVEKGEVWLFNVHINPYSHRGYVDHDPKRKRRLLLHKYEIRKLIGKTVEKGLTLVPTRMYFKNGKVKVAIALAKGKQDHDKRETLRRREIDRETRAAVKERDPAMKVLVVGAAGQLGQAMVAHAGRRARGHAVDARGRRSDPPPRRPRRDASARAGRRSSTARATTNVDRAEDEQETALDVNAIVVRTLARAAAELDAVLMHYSTDFVFSGTAAAPYTEIDRPEPQSVYAQSKLVGEWMAADAPQALRAARREPVRRPASRAAASIASSTRCAPASRRRCSSIAWCRRASSPTSSTRRRICCGRGPPSGLYHCVNTGHATWLDVGREIARLLGKPDDRCSSRSRCAT